MLSPELNARRKSAGVLFGADGNRRILPRDTITNGGAAPALTTR